MALFIFQKENPLHSTIPYNSNIYANKCISWLPTVTSSVSVFVCNCLTDVSFMDFILKWVSKFTNYGLFRIYWIGYHTSFVALSLMNASRHSTRFIGLWVMLRYPWLHFMQLTSITQNLPRTLLSGLYLLKNQCGSGRNRTFIYRLAT